VCQRLPEESKRCLFRVVAPARSAAALRTLTTTESSVEGDESPKAVIILLTSTGEQGSGPRVAVAKELARRLGFFSVVPTAPLYGRRRPKGQKRHYISTAAKILDQSTGVFTEAGSLACWCADRFPNAKIIISGFSWGGAMCAGAAILGANWMRDDAQRHRLGAAPYVGAHSPEILVDSVIYHDIDWKSLALEAESLDDAENRLRAIFGKSSIAGLVADVNGVTLAQLDDESFKPRRYLQASHSVITLNDKFVSIPSMMRLHHGLVKACPEGKAKYTEVVGGHLLAWLRRKTLQVDAINEVYQELCLS